MYVQMPPDYKLFQYADDAFSEKWHTSDSAVKISAQFVSMSACL